MIKENEKTVVKKWLNEVGKYLVREDLKSRHNTCPSCNALLIGEEKVLQCSNCKTKIINIKFDGLGLA